MLISSAPSICLLNLPVLTNISIASPQGDPFVAGKYD